MHERTPTPSSFIVLYRYFLPRVIDLEAITQQGDPAKLLGQIASVLLMISIVVGGMALIFDTNHLSKAVQINLLLTSEHRLIALSLVVVGLFTVLSWNSIFPDKRDVMMLGVLPLRSSTIFTAKLAASASALGVATIILNCFSGLTWPILLHRGGPIGALAGHWLIILLASIWIFSAIIAVQGLLTLFVPRKYALRISAFFQISAFCCLLATYFLEPGLVTATLIENPHVNGWLSWSPSYWFVALYVRMIGITTPAVSALAMRAELSLLIVISLAISTWLFSYFRLMRKIVEIPDIQSGAIKMTRLPGVSSSVHNAVLLFSARSLLRSSQHRIVHAFYLGVGLAVALSTLHLPATSRDLLDANNAIDLRLVIGSIVMACFATLGGRMVFTMPIHLHANWIVRVTELRKGTSYLRATRTSLAAFSLVPTMLGTLFLGAITQPWRPLFLYLLTLGLFGGVLIEAALLNFNKIPFTCTRQPGKRNVGFAFWLYLLVLVPMTEWTARFEQKALQHTWLYIVPIVSLLSALLILRAYNSREATSTPLLFDDVPPAALQSLGL